ncbi:MAG: sensor domain-containing diguanylate cyclase [Gammaproteobacteria bacterium]
MLKPPTPMDETQRLVSLHSLRILDTPSEERFDRITRMAQRLFDVEICLVSLVDSNRQWFKSKQGLEACQTGRDISFCGHAILSDELFIVENASEDPRFADNPLVTEDPSIGFYAGCPLHGPNGHRIGTLCLIDKRARSMSDEDMISLRDLAGMVEDELAVSSQVTVDDLTQVANRRGFNMVATQLLSLCERTGIDAELVFFDLDGFKAINDTHGHGAGDDVLKHFAKLLLKCFRDADVIARFGGDEFVVLMAASRGCSDTAVKRLEQMAAAEECEIKLKLAWSVGKIQFDPERHDSVEKLLSDADARMYDDKLRRQQTGS